MFCVRAFARRSLQLSLQSLRSSRSSLLRPSKERAGIPCRNPALNSPPGRIESIWETLSKERGCPQWGILPPAADNADNSICCRAAPARRHGGTQLMMSHMLSPTTKQCPIMWDTGSIVRRSRSSVRLFLTGKIGRIECQIE